MKEIYLITNYAKLDGVLDLYTDKHIAESDMSFYHDGGKRGETNLIKIEYDGRIFDYDRENYSINFFEKREN